MDAVGFMSIACAVRQEPAGNHRKKSEKFTAGILLPQNHRNQPEASVSGPGGSTCVVYTHMKLSDPSKENPKAFKKLSQFVEADVRVIFVYEDLLIGSNFVKLLAKY